jgi:hypothetical protein
MPFPGTTGATIDFLLSALRDAAAAKRLFRKALSEPSHPQPRVINTDQARSTTFLVPRPLSVALHVVLPTAEWIAALRLGDYSSERGRNPAPPLPTSTGPILEQHPGAGSSGLGPEDLGVIELHVVGRSVCNEIKRSPQSQSDALLSRPSDGLSLRR